MRGHILRILFGVGLMMVRRSSIGYVITSILLIAILVITFVIQYYNVRVSNSSYLERLDRDVGIIGGVFRVLYCIDVPIENIESKRINMSVVDMDTKIVIKIWVSNSVLYSIELDKESIDCIEFRNYTAVDNIS